MKSNNRIPRKAVKLDVTWKVDTLAKDLGAHATVYRENDAWHCDGIDGKTYFIFTSYLHNPALCNIDRAYEAA